MRGHVHDSVGERWGKTAVNLALGCPARIARVVNHLIEIEEIIQTVAARAGLSVEETRRKAAESEEIGRWRRDVLKNKVLDFLKEQAEVEE